MGGGGGVGGEVEDAVLVVEGSGEPDLWVVDAHHGRLIELREVRMVEETPPRALFDELTEHEEGAHLAAGVLLAEPEPEPELAVVGAEEAGLAPLFDAGAEACGGDGITELLGEDEAHREEA